MKKTTTKKTYRRPSRYPKYPAKVTKRVTARKYGGDDAYSWAVFIDGRPMVTGLNNSIVPHYRNEAHKIVAKKMGVEPKPIEKI
jgi:hypothetical protein